MIQRPAAISRTSIDSACASSPSARASGKNRRRQPRQPGAGDALHRHHAHEIGGASGRRGSARRRPSAARGSIRSRSRRPPARCTGRRTRRPAVSGRFVSDSRSTHEMLGREAVRQRHRLVRVARDDDGAVRGQRLRARSRARRCARSTAARRASASGRLQVMKIARASGSCSACAIEIGGDPRRRPPPATITISVGPA